MQPKLTAEELAAEYATGRRDFRNIDLTRQDLSGMMLADVDLRGATLRDADFTDADLSGANLAGTTYFAANGTVFRRTNLERANLTGAQLTFAILENARLTFECATGPAIDEHTWFPTYGPYIEGMTVDGGAFDHETWKQQRLERENQMFRDTFPNLTR